MTKLTWDAAGTHLYETGVDHGVLYVRDNTGDYPLGVAWNGLTTVTESPSGAESTKTYADNIIYLNLVSAEEYAATIEAYTYPDEFAECDGSAVFFGGVKIGQQNRKPFGFAYRTIVGNDLEGNDFGKKLHLVYGATASPSENAHATVNDSPEASQFSWEVTTVPVSVGEVDGVEYKPTASMEIDSTKVDADAFAALEDILFGTAGTDPRLPLPAEVIALFDGTLVVATPAQPAFNSGTHTITIPATTGVDYLIDGEVQAAGAVVITEDTIVTARPQAGYRFSEPIDDDWFYDYV